MSKNNDVELIDQFNLNKTGSLLTDLTKVDIKISKLPDIEVKEVVIRETGNFLDLQENAINIPIEMIVFPFFTPQKQNKKINFKYSFEDMGVTMYCTLVAKNSEDKVYQPSIFEEKIYTYLISLYELKKEINDTDEYIKFEISDFIVNFLGNKMNRNYYTKVAQALKNLKSTEYQFEVSNHSKLGNYQFEDEEFKLLTYQKLKVGTKVFYKITLNKNIRNKIKDKRYIKYNSKALIKIMEKDPIAARIYKYISMKRYSKQEDSINIRTLAAIIPLKMEQATERLNKDGVMRVYVLSRVKQVLKRIEKAFDLLKDQGYVKYYNTEFIAKEDSYYVNYRFNEEKDGSCHISTYLNGSKQVEYKGKWDDVNAAKKAKKQNKFTTKEEVEQQIKEIEKFGKQENIQDAEIVLNEKVVDISKLSKEVKERLKGFTEIVQIKIVKAKRNIHVSKAWNKRVDNKFRKIVLEDGEEIAIEILDLLYKRLNTEIKSTLVQYVNGILKIVRKKERTTRKSNKNNLTLFGNTPKEMPQKRKKQIREAKKKTNISDGHIVENLGKGQDIDIMEEYNKLEDLEKLKLEEKAINLCSQYQDIPKDFLYNLKKISKKVYFITLKKYIELALKEEK
ncbi:MAG: replication initiator protein A [Psychrilyobacter sp.]|nr:replication initiator protein A [Psychrilyobacter sp.]